MTTISIFPEDAASQERYRAVAGDRQSVGATAGEALDALTAQIDEPGGTMVVLVQHTRPDAFFTAEQQQRLAELLARWRAARDGGAPLAAAEQAELEALVEAELRAATLRAEAIARAVGP
jgi:hypothetical protein